MLLPNCSNLFYYFLQYLFIFCEFTRIINAGGPYPNYHANFEFNALDKDKTVKHYAAHEEWWHSASFYQIYPRSFMDSDGDGIGDLKGIEHQLPYLKEIGITAAWISPIFASPMADFGYDVSNYTAIASIFGTMQDFDDLIQTAKRIGIRILLDFVPNHTSDESLWFQLSAQKDPAYKDFYVWHPGKMVNGVRHPPTNWLSVFRGSAWKWHEERQEYYLHQFLDKQPDLNYRNPKVRETMKDVLRFWLNKGVSGFRVDAVPFMFEVAPGSNGNSPDEPRNPSNTDPDDYGYLQHIYTVNQPETLTMLYEFRAVLDDFRQKNRSEQPILMTEAYAPLDVVMQYYGNGTAEGAQVPFNFLMIERIANNSDAYHYAETINTWLRSMPVGRVANWVIGNHDQYRVGSRLGEQRINMMNMLIMSLPGCSVTYNGEEIGMTDVWISWNDTVDPSACNSNPDIYEKYSRDPERTPFQWNDRKNAGFSPGKKTWLPISKNYKEVNVDRERGIVLSHLNIFKQMQEVRSEPTMRFGRTEVKAIETNAVLGVKRALLHELTYITLMNIFNQTVTVSLTKAFNEIPDEMEYVIVTNPSGAKIRDITETQSVHLAPFEAIVLRSLTRLTTTAGYFTYYEASPNK